MGEGGKGQQHCGRPIRLCGSQLATEVVVPTERGQCLGIAGEENGALMGFFSCSVLKKIAYPLNDSVEEGCGGNDSPAGGLEAPIPTWLNVLLFQKPMKR